MSDDDDTCLQCRALLTPWPTGPRAPLVLPGTRGLSADDVRAPRMPFIAIGGIALGVTVSAIALATMPERTRDDARTSLAATAARFATVAPAPSPGTMREATGRSYSADVAYPPIDQAPGAADAAMRSRPTRAPAMHATPVATRVTSVALDAPRGRREPTNAPPRPAVAAAPVRTVRAAVPRSSAPATPVVAAAASRATEAPHASSTVAANSAPTAAVALPGATDAMVAASAVAAAVRQQGVESAAVRAFMADGATHRVAVMGTPVIIGQNATGIRIAFDLRLTKFDGGGRPVTRIAPVTMQLSRQDGAVRSSSPDVGALQKP